MAINKVIYDVSGEEIVDTEGHVTVYGIDGISNRVNKVVYGQQVLIDITDTTATANEVLSGYVAYGANGVKITGTAGENLNANGGEVDDDTLIVGSGGGTVNVTDEANATGITCVITTGSEPTPTPSETWETLFNNLKAPTSDTPYGYFWFNELPDVYPTIDSVWRVTIDGTEYRCVAYYHTSLGLVCFGNPKYSGGTDDGSDAPFNFYNAGWGALVADTEVTAGVNHTVKIERLVTE